MAQTSEPRPFTPAVARGEARATSIARALVAYARCGDLAEARESVKDDPRALSLLTRSSTTPHTPSSLTTFNETTISAAVDILGPNNVASQIFQRAGVVVTFDNREQAAWAPGVSDDLTHVSFVPPGAPSRFLQYDLSKGVTVASGMKISFGIAWTHELLVRSDAVSFLRQKMQEDCGKALDGFLFDSNAAVAGTRPAGLLNGVQTVAASTSTVPGDALVADLAGLAAAVGLIGGEVIFVGNVSETTRIQARLPFFPGVYASSAVTAGNLIAIAPRGIAVAGSVSGARLDTSTETAIVLDDALTTAMLSTAGSPNVIAAPVASAFQADLGLLRLVLPDLNWAQRVAAGAGGCVAQLSGTLKW